MNKMSSAFEPDQLLKAWLPFRDAIGFSSIRTPKDFAKASKFLDQLVDIVGNNEKHPLADVLHYVGNQIEVYEDEHLPIPEGEPAEVLRFLMEQHDLKQSDLSDCMPPSRVSEILNGRREISKDIAKKLAKRFKVSVEVFI
jgi:HTH-type transcriptional regulator / antitoxin HigA